MPIVTIVGKPNVGKSTLFNRIVGKRLAVTSPVPGVTRDRNYATADWNGVYFVLVDTGGFVPYPDEPLLKGVKRQVELAIAESDSIIFVVAHNALSGMDCEIAELLRKSNKPTLLAVNKVDNQTRELSSAEFHSLGFTQLLPISALHGRGVGDLLDQVVSELPFSPEPETKETLRIAVIGKPNVGKSSLVNALLGEERVLVDEVPGTTRDSIDTEFEHDGRKMVLIDTAGLRRKARIKDGVEYYTVLRSMRSVQRCDVAVVMIEAPLGVTRQDKRIISLPFEFGKGMVLVVNKIDLVPSEDDTLEQVKSELEFLDYFPLIPTSCTEKKGIFDVVKLAILVHEGQIRTLTQTELTSFLTSTLSHYPPPSKGKRRPVIKKITQVGVKPPTFLLKVTGRDFLTENYLRYVRNSLRTNFRFVGTPIVLRTSEERRRIAR